MNTYDVYLRNDLQWAKREFIATTPESALQLAREFADREPACLDFEYIETPADAPVRKIEVCDEDGASLAIWHHADMRPRLATPDLRCADEKTLWQNGDLGLAIHEFSVAVAAANGGAA